MSSQDARGASGRLGGTGSWLLFSVAVLALGLAGYGVWTADMPLVWSGLVGVAFTMLWFMVANVRPQPLAAPAAADSSSDALQGAINRAMHVEPADDLVEFSIEPTPAKASRPEGAWPEASQKQWDRFRTQRLPPGEFEVPPAFQRRREFTRDLPLVRSIFEEEPQVAAEPERTGKTRGQCSGCQTYLWAPKERPIRLRCPKCGKVALLTA